MASPPAKKSDVDAEVPQSPDDTGAENQGPMDEHNQGLEVEVKEQDRWLPIANVARIMKSALPENAKIAKEAKECMQECVSEFISFITSEASEKCQQEKRKTVNGEDILFAMTSLGFENYSEALKIYLARYRETLLASSKSSGGPAGAGGGNGAGVAGAAAPGAYGEPGQVLNDDMDGADQGQAYGYGVPHGANGTGEY